MTRFLRACSSTVSRFAARSHRRYTRSRLQPLMITGIGFGKTILLTHGTTSQENYRAKVLYVSTETFLNDFIRASKLAQLALHDRYLRERRIVDR